MGVAIQPHQRDSASMSELDTAEERRQAINVRDALHRLLGKLESDEMTTPSELSVWLRKSGHKVSCLFAWMACTAVAAKYQQAEKHDVAGKLLALRMAQERYWQHQELDWSDRQALHGVARTVQVLYQGHKRISHYQSRWICPDLDIILCAGTAYSIDLGITPWVCQQPDLRFRWTDTGMVRLAYLTDCWDAYAQCDLTWADRLIGLPDFPTHSEFC